MRCKACDYSLWNLKARECPECGQPFKPGDFDFVPHTVRFCCPECDQAYFGTDYRGHLRPRQFACVKCGTAIDMDQMILRPAEGVVGRQTEPGVMPWLERHKLGRFRALVATIWRSMITPGALMRGLPQDARTGEALAFGGILLTLIALAGGTIPYFTRWAWEYVYWFDDLQMVVLFVVTVLVATAFPIALLVLWAMAAHLTLRLTGGCAFPFDRTIQVMSYSAGANVLSAVPCFGPYVGWIWWLISAALMLREGQRVHALRAVMAVLALPMMMALLIGGGTAGAWYWALKQGYISQDTYNEATMQTIHLTTQLSYRSYGLGGEIPVQHAMELTLGSALGFTSSSGLEGVFCHHDTQTTADSVPFGAGTLANFEELPHSRKLTVIASVLDALPENLIAHRFGDYIFVHHGADLSTHDPNLWVVVLLPDPDANGAPAPNTPVQIGTNDNSVREIEFSELAEATQEQNEYRAEIELPPLPDLATITHARPATAPAASDVTQPATRAGE